MAKGSNRYRVIRPISTQALPMEWQEDCVNALINTKATAIPVVADKKFCTVSPIIWLK